MLKSLLACVCVYLLLCFVFTLFEASTCLQRLNGHTISLSALSLLIHSFLSLAFQMTRC
jgi:hypothetical protein